MIRELFDLRKYKSILCLDGDLPEPSFFLNLDLPIIAADGAANTLNRMNLKPSIIIGDLDSVTSELLEQNSYLHLPDQDSSDYQKSLEYLRNSELLPAIVVGISGGYLDHILNNINLFIDTDCLLYAPPITGFVLKDRIDLSLALDTKISLMGIPKAEISSEGLKWELNRAKLSFPGPTSCFNQSVGPVSLTVHEGSLLVLIYTTTTSPYQLQSDI